MATIPIFNPVSPILAEIPGGFRPTLMVRIKGKIHGHGRCQIDFVNSPSLHCNQDVIFHVSIRPNDKVIVRNHYQNGSWAMEERYGPCRVKKNETFEIVLLAEHQHYKIAVNGHHLGVFRHRLPLHLVRYVNVSGEVTLDHILLEQDQASSQNQMIVSQVVSTPAFQQTPIYPMMTPNYPIRPANPTVHVHVQPPVYPPPPYFGNQQHSSYTRIGGVVIERHHGPGTVIIRQRHGRSTNVFRF